MRLSLRWKLLLSYLAVALAGALALVVAAELASGAFYEDHIREMTASFGGDHAETLRADLERGFSLALGRSLLVGLAVAVPLAVGLGVWVTRRVLGPVSDLSSAARRIASGSYSERLPVAERDELGRLIEEFNRMAGALEGVEARRVELIGTVAHELRTPLAGLQGYAEGLADGLFDPDQAAESIRREVARLRRVVNDLSEVSRAEAGALELRPEPFDLCALARELAERYRPMAEGAGSSLRLECPDGTVLTLADRDRAAQIAVNLISNALRHAPGSPVALCVSRDGALVRFAIADAGPGIAPEHVPHVFERFYRVDRARSRALGVSGGSGVGLTISLALARAMGGRLEVESELGRGSRFTLSLPAVGVPTPAAANTSVTG